MSRLIRIVFANFPIMFWLAAPAVPFIVFHEYLTAALIGEAIMLYFIFPYLKEVYRLLVYFSRNGVEIEATIKGTGISDGRQRVQDSEIEYEYNGKSYYQFYATEYVKPGTKIAILINPKDPDDFVQI